MLSQIKRNRLRIATFLVCFLILFVTEMEHVHEPWTCDCSDYWSRGEILKNSGFYLGSINGFRGYAFPVFLGFINLIGGKAAWYILNAALIVTFTSVILPFIVLGKHEYTKKTAVSDILMIVLIDVLFRGLVIYPLSDFFAALCLAAGAFFLRKFVESTKLIPKLVFALLTGAFCYLAYNIRTIYMFAGIALILTFIIIQLHNTQAWSVKIKNIVCGLVSGIVGMVTAGIPQLVMNIINSGKASIAVPTNGLTLQQMFWGIQYQRYDTYIPDFIDAAHPHPQVYFIDPAGTRLLEQAQLTTFSNWGEFFRLFFRHPFDIAAIYVRHLINFIFPCWPEMYVKNLNSSKWLLGIIGITVLFLAIAAWIEKCYRKYDGLIYFLPIVVPAILIIPGAVEFRFSLPFYIFAMAQVCMNVDWKSLRDCFVQQKVKYIFTYGLLLILCLAIWSSMLASETVTKLFL